MNDRALDTEVAKSHIQKGGEIATGESRRKLDL